MFRKIFVLVMMAFFVVSCQKGKEEARKFSKDYTETTKEFRAKRSQVKSRDAYIAYKAERKKEFETLLQKYEESPSVEGIEMLRSKVLLQLDRLDEAEKKIDHILGEGPESIDEAKMAKVQILIARKKYSEAFDIFKDIESGVKDPYDLFNAYYYFALEHEDNNVKVEYSRKFLDAADLPEQFARNRYQMYGNLAAVATIGGDFEKARKFLEDGIAETKEPRRRLSLERQSAQLDFVGKPAFPLSTETWFNSSPQVIERLKGKVVIVFFWAPWCPYCRSMTPLLIEKYDKNMEQGLMVIGITRLYGTYRDDLVDKGKVGKDEEMEFIKKYLERKGILFPILVTNDKADFDRYKISGLPTMVFIDREGNIDFFKIGSGDINFIKDKIRSLLEEG